MPELSSEQKAVDDAIEAFLGDPRPPKRTFNFMGPAGTGKSFVLSAVARRHPYAELVAFTGKAASVLARRTGRKATTVHAAIYRFMGEDDDGELSFEAKISTDQWRRKVALLDEFGTINTQLMHDLLATGCRVVACGDFAQLKPVTGTPYFTGADMELTEVRRQAWDSPIIRQAHSVLRDGTYAADGPDFRIERFIGAEDILAADIVLCWRNATRRMLNKLVRAHRGMDGAPLQPKESVMCLRNDHKRALLNGAIYELLEEHRPNDGRLVLRNELGYETDIGQAWVEDFDAPILSERAMPFALANAATVHKFQGSEGNRIILVDEYDRTEERVPWLYTGITRAAKSIIVQRA